MFGNHYPALSPHSQSRYNLSAHLDPHNTGVLIVDLDGNERGTRTRDAGGLIDSMDKDEGTDCVIM